MSSCLAIDRDCRGQGLGSAMLVDAAQRVIDSDIAAFALIVDAKDEPAMAFYEHHGFSRLGAEGTQEGATHSLFLVLKTIAARLQPRRH